MSAEQLKTPIDTRSVGFPRTVTLDVRAEQLAPEDAAAFWPQVLATAPDYLKYVRRTTRAIPLLRLTPSGPTTTGLLGS